MKSDLNRAVSVLATAWLCGVTCNSAAAAVEVIGVQYKPVRMFPEDDCFCNFAGYPNSCRTNQPGAHVYVYLKNTGAAPVTITDAMLAGYSLNTVIRMSTDTSINPGQQNSIYFYWDNPPQDILDAGEPVWYKVDPSTPVPPGGVAQIVVRLRVVPVTNPVGLTIVTSGGTLNASVTADAGAPQLASAGFSQDRKKVYLHWRRTGGRPLPRS